ncbi:plasmid stabilization protein [Caulobacter vibrioides]|nr:plasmid stabilization protein [Caulobacter vibrioides]
MTAKPVVPSNRARADINAAFEWYLREAGPSVAIAFVDAMHNAYRIIAEQPAAGSPRYAHELKWPGLRTWPLKRYPYLVFYVEEPDRIEIWRVFHGQQDIPASLRG